MMLPLFLSASEVCKLTNLSQSTLYRLCLDGDFPAPKKISGGRNAWAFMTVINWASEVAGVEASELIVMYSNLNKLAEEVAFDEK
ncbi:helix-turn-helix domain-containing protein [Pseudoalteromonas sp. YIC-656]|uniref:helix-turn-helix transcriptional regulator n=1 Tax=Pseudoalteromonas TaxID=53246 RepID=UPI000CF66579|nr:helix-turn-helix domain-containing protein [Pseudoalteromonas sp. T1lg75]